MVMKISFKMKLFYFEEANSFEIGKDLVEVIWMLNSLRRSKKFGSLASYLYKCYEVFYVQLVSNDVSKLG